MVDYNIKIDNNFTMCLMTISWWHQSLWKNNGRFMISQFVTVAHWYVYTIRTIIDHVSTGYDNIMFFDNTMAIYDFKTHYDVIKFGLWHHKWLGLHNGRFMISEWMFIRNQSIITSKLTMISQCGLSNHNHLGHQNGKFIISKFIMTSQPYQNHITVVDLWIH